MLKNLYLHLRRQRPQDDKILADQEMVEWLNDTMLLEVDTMSEDDVKAHIENVKSIVEQYKDIVAG